LQIAWRKYTRSIHQEHRRIIRYCESCNSKVRQAIQSLFLSSLNNCYPIPDNTRVTPGNGPVRATFVFPFAMRKLLMIVDFPTLGIPITIIPNTFFTFVVDGKHFTASVIRLEGSLEALLVVLLATKKQTLWSRSAKYSVSFWLKHCYQCTSFTKIYEIPFEGGNLLNQLC
jgi:hypothetical protein